MLSWSERECEFDCCSTTRVNSVRTRSLTRRTRESRSGVCVSLPLLSSTLCCVAPFSFLFFLLAICDLCDRSRSVGDSTRFAQSRKNKQDNDKPAKSTNEREGRTSRDEDDGRSDMRWQAGFTRARWRRRCKCAMFNVLCWLRYPTRYALRRCCCCANVCMFTCRPSSPAPLSYRAHCLRWYPHPHQMSPHRMLAPLSMPMVGIAST